ncbi:hypothetical protein SGPA1_21177 [Streptomyces misionensis JCM 4497]
MRRGFEGKPRTGRMGVGGLGRRRADARSLGGGPARPGHQQRRRTHRPGAAVDRGRPRGAAGGPDGLPVRHEGRHHLAAGLEAQRLEDVRRQAGRQPGAGGAHRRPPGRQVGGVPLRTGPPGRRRPAQRLRRPRRQPGRLGAGGGGQRARLAGAAALARHPQVLRPAQEDGPPLRRRVLLAHPQGEVPRPLRVRPLLRGRRVHRQEPAGLGPSGVPHRRGLIRRRARWRALTRPPATPFRPVPNRPRPPVAPAPAPPGPRRGAGHRVTDCRHGRT